jgi:hypothetical protein
MTDGKTRMRYATVAFWFAIACLVVARVLLFDPAKIYPPDVVSANEAPALAGQHYR